MEGTTVMRQGLLRGSRYSPGNMDRESLENLFVGRHDVMDDVLARVAESIKGPERHYILLVGPWGAGKTHFMALARHRLMDLIEATSARESIAVAVLNEEERGVASFLDLVVRILRALADQAPDLDAEIAAIYDRFWKDPAYAESFAVTKLREHTRGKTLLLLCENLLGLFQGLGEEGQKRWRAVIQEDGNWTIVASTPSLFAAIQLQKHPFYGFFTIRTLEKADFDTGLELLVRKAGHEGKTELAEFLRTPLGRARARAIHHLAAGNHRAYIVLSDFLDKESLDDLVDPFMQMVDDLTPHYQDRMRLLPPAQRRIVEFLCLKGTPTTIKDISTPCLMSHQSAAKQIGELETSRFLSRMRFGRNTFCELSEPLMRICMEVQNNRTRHFREFIEFLRHWFTAKETKRQHAMFQHVDRFAHFDQVHVEEAVRCTFADRHDPIVETLRDEAERYRDAGDCHSLLIAASKIREIGDYQSAGRFLDRIAELQPDNRDLYMERTRLHIDEGALDAAANCGAKMEALPGGALLGRLLAAQASAAAKPLSAAVDTLQDVITRDDFECDHARHRQAAVEILTVSTRIFGPLHLPDGLVKLLDLLKEVLDEGIAGKMLIDFLKANINEGFAGPLENWEAALENLRSSLTHRPDCRIPLEMLRVTVTYTKTGDKKHLLSLPLEQRQLLEKILPPTVGGIDLRRRGNRPGVHDHVEPDMTAAPRP